MAGVIAVNLIWSHELNHRQFKELLDRIKSEYGEIYYCEVHWLSKGRVMLHFLSLLEEIKAFHSETGQPVSRFERWSMYSVLLDKHLWVLE
jgi:hypothetical protein